MFVVTDTIMWLYIVVSILSVTLHFIHRLRRTKEEAKKQNKTETSSETTTTLTIMTTTIRGVGRESVKRF